MSFLKIKNIATTVTYLHCRIKTGPGKTNVYGKQQIEKQADNPGIREPRWSAAAKQMNQSNTSLSNAAIVAAILVTTLNNW